MLRRTALKPVSERRAAEHAQWQRVAQQCLVRDGFRCRGREFGLEHECGGKLDPHHLWPLGRGGPRLDLDNLVTLCRVAHDWSHRNPAVAGELGLLRSGSHDDT